MSEAIRADLRANTHALYRFYSRTGQLLYVGITNDPSKRFKEHGLDKPWWSRVAEIKIERFSSRAELAAAEIRAIETEHPRYNRAHSAGLAEELHVRSHTSPLWPDANRFGNEPPREHPDAPQAPRRVGVGWPCTKCSSYRVYRAADDRWKPTGDVCCPDCNSQWTPEEWRRANGFSL